jgi:hypothetical protein
LAFMIYDLVQTIHNYIYNWYDLNTVWDLVWNI